MAPLYTHRFGLAYMVKVLGVALLCAGIVWYGFFQARFLISGPSLTLETPGTTVQHDRVVSVRGYAKNITELTLNGKTIHTNEDGYFEDMLVLPEGYTIMTLHGEDRYGRSRSLERTLVYQPNDAADAISLNH